MAAAWRFFGVSIAAMAIFAGLSTAAEAVDRFSVNIVNQRAFMLSLELRDKVCGSGVLLRAQLKPGESREIQICASLKGLGALRATFGSGCSQVKRTEFLDIEPGDTITF